MQRGFSLIEVTISIFILGVMLILLQGVARSSVLVRVSKSQGIALSIARNKLEATRSAGYANIPLTTTFSDSLMSTLPTGATTTVATSTFSAKTEQITIGVVWRDPTAAASTTVSLSTLITQTGGLP